MKLPAITAGPWKACRSHEDFAGPYWEEDEPDEKATLDAKPFTSIDSASNTVANAHDLFTFKSADALAIAALPALLAALDGLLGAPADAARQAEARAALLLAGATE